MWIAVDLPALVKERGCVLKIVLVVKLVVVILPGLSSAAKDVSHYPPSEFAAVVWSASQ